MRLPTDECPSAEAVCRREGYRTPPDVDALFDAVEREVGKSAKSHRLVTVVDWRRCPVMSPAAAARIADRIVLNNGRTERSAALARSNSPVAVLQFLRVIREAGLADRKLYFAAGKLVEWLSAVLTGAECRRLKEFVAEAPPCSIERGLESWRP
ncbi:MAG: hypothetical protein ACRENE_34535 [Polyangiaceae bacterium]